jgi:hypothetical protein
MVCSLSPWYGDGWGRSLRNVGNPDGTVMSITFSFSFSTQLSVRWLRFRLSYQDGEKQ